MTELRYISGSSEQMYFEWLKHSNSVPGKTSTDACLTAAVANGDAVHGRKFEAWVGRFNELRYLRFAISADAAYLPTTVSSAMVFSGSSESAISFQTIVSDAQKAIRGRRQEVKSLALWREARGTRSTRTKKR